VFQKIQVEVHRSSSLNKITARLAALLIVVWQCLALASSASPQRAGLSTVIEVVRPIQAPRPGDTT
jgi:hypothetical protein